MSRRKVEKETEEIEEKTTAEALEEDIENVKVEAESCNEIKEAEKLEDITEELENIVENVEIVPIQKPKKKWKKIIIWTVFILFTIGVFVFTLLNDLLGDKPISFVGLEKHWWFLLLAVATTAAFFLCRAIGFSIMMPLFTGKINFRQQVSGKVRKPGRPQRHDITKGIIHPLGNVNRP